MTIEQAYHALNSPYVDNTAIHIQHQAHAKGEAERADDGTWFACWVHLPDAEAQRVMEADPCFPKDS